MHKLAQAKKLQTKLKGETKKIKVSETSLRNFVDRDSVSSEVWSDDLLRLELLLLLRGFNNGICNLGRGFEGAGGTGTVTTSSGGTPSVDGMLLRNSSEELENSVDATLPAFYTADCEKKLRN